MCLSKLILGGRFSLRDSHQQEQLLLHREKSLHPDQQELAGLALEQGTRSLHSQGLRSETSTLDQTQQQASKKQFQAVPTTTLHQLKIVLNTV